MWMKFKKFDEEAHQLPYVRTLYHIYLDKTIIIQDIVIHLNTSQ